MCKQIQYLPSKVPEDALNTLNEPRKLLPDIHPGAKESTYRFMICPSIEDKPLMVMPAEWGYRTLPDDTREN